MWQFWIDRGGTFTDIVARKPNGSIIIDKLLSENSGIYKDAAIAGIKKILNLKNEDNLYKKLKGYICMCRRYLEYQGYPKPDSSKSILHQKCFYIFLFFLCWSCC